MHLCINHQSQFYRVLGPTFFTAIKMNLVAIASIVLVVISTVKSDISRVKVDVYYEALCPFARKFVVDQLYKALQTGLSKYVDLTLIPYGKASTTFENGTYNFTCHHGPFECYGNIIQACALRLIDNGRNTPGLGYNEKTLGFINCLMSTRNALNSSLPNTDVCGESNHVPFSTIYEIASCAVDERTNGSLYLAKLGNQTRNFQNPLGNVPSVVFSEEYKKEESDLAEKDFIKALCAKIQGEKPAECYKNGTHRFGVSAGLLLVAILTRYFY